MSKEDTLEIEVMNKTFNDLHGPSGGQTDAPSTEAPSPNPTDAPVTDEPSTDAPSTDVSATDAPSTDAPTTDVPDEKDQIIADLRAKLDKKDPEPKSTDAPTTQAPLELETQDFIGDLDLENLTGNKEDFNRLLNLVYSKGVTDSRNIINEGVSGTIPSLVSNQINMATEMKEIRDNFYSNNEDLKAFPNVVSTVFEDIAKKSPNETYDNIIKAVAPEVRKRLNLPEYEPGNDKDKKDDKGNPPRLPRKKGKSGRSQTKPKPSPIESELDEMNEVLGR